MDETLSSEAAAQSRANPIAGVHRLAFKCGVLDDQAPAHRHGVDISLAYYLAEVDEGVHFNLHGRPARCVHIAYVCRHRLCVYDPNIFELIGNRASYISDKRKNQSSDYNNC